MTIKIDSAVVRSAPSADRDGTGGQRRCALPGGFLRGGGAHGEEVRAVAPVDRRRDGTGCAVPPHLPLRLRRLHRPYGVAHLRGLLHPRFRGHQRAVLGHGRCDRHRRGPSRWLVRSPAQPPDPPHLDHLGPGDGGHVPPRLEPGGDDVLRSPRRLPHAERRRRRGGRVRTVRPLRVRLLLAVHRPRPRWPAARRRPRGSRSSSSRCRSSPAPMCRSPPCPDGCRPSPTTSR